MDPADLERLADRRLRSLPTPRAPRTLLPRILAAIADEARRPWYARAWMHWPLRWQVASSALALLVVAVATWTGPTIAALMLDRAAASSIPASSYLAGAPRTLESAWDAARIVWNVVEPAAQVVGVLLLVMSVACVAFGTALDRVIALGGASES